jgi:lipoprotein
MRVTARSYLTTRTRVYDLVIAIVVTIFASACLVKNVIDFAILILRFIFVISASKLSCTLYPTHPPS